jgi:hypothetical protein
MESMRRFQAAVVCAALFCASLATLASDQDVKPGGRVAVRLAPGNGIVMARIVANRSVGEYFSKWQGMIVRNVATKKRHRLVDRSPRASVQSVFAAALPPGRYEVLEVGAENMSGMGGWMWIREGAKFDPKLFTFTIEAKRATNLGSIIYLRPYFPLNTRVFRWTFEPDPALPAQIAYLLDDAGKAVLDGESLGWSNEGVARAGLTPDVKHLSMVLAGRVPLTDGPMLFGENFGQIAKRDASGNWTWEETGVFDTIQAATQTPDGTMYAVADNSLLLMRESGGSWHRLDVPLAGALPRYLGVDQVHGLFTVWEQDQGVTVLVASDAKKPTWTTTKTIKPGIQFGGGPVRSFVMPLQNQIVVAVSTAKLFASQYDLHIFDLVKKEWTVKELRAYGPISALPDGTLYSMTGPNIKQTFKVSSDWGQTWEAGDSMSWAGQPFFRTRQEGYVVRSGNVLTMNPENLKSFLWRTLDGGKTWQQHAELPNLVALVLGLAGEQMLIVTHNGKMYFSPDNGKTLKVERDSTRTEF